MRVTTYILSLASIALFSGCGNGYMLYNTRYIPDSGYNAGSSEVAGLPWRPPFIEGQSYQHTPSRGNSAIVRYQTPPKLGVDRDIWDAHFDGDDSGSGRLDSRHIENADTALPSANVNSVRK